MSNFFHRLYRVFFICNAEKKLFNFFRKNKKTLSGKEGTVLVQCVENYYYYGLFGVIVSSLKNNSNIHVDQYIVRSLALGSTSSIRGFISKLLFSNRFRDNKWKRLYSSYCDRVAFRCEGSSNIIFDLKALLQAYKIYKKIRTKKQLLELIIENVEVGDLIYDSYLRFKPAPTVDVNDYYLYIIIWQSLRSINISKKYFNKNKPNIFLTSYSTYIHHGIPVRVALQLGTKVYSFGNLQMPYKRLTKDDYYHTENFSNYSADFEILTNKEENLKKAKIALEGKLNGKIDTSIAYMKRSAYQLSVKNIPNIKGHTVIFLHDFYDSPHVYGSMVFPDFLEWINFTIETLEECEIPYLVKPHPNQILDSEKVVDMLKINYPNATFISPKVTNRQLVDNGMKAGISVYGTVAHELVYMGVPVILCGKNPHSSYNFCHTAHNKNEYRDLLKGLACIKATKNNKQEVESFYYMHNLNSSEEMRDLMNRFVRLLGCTQGNVFLDYNALIKILKGITMNKEYRLFISQKCGNDFL
jgi:hypothetical protein